MGFLNSYTSAILVLLFVGAHADASLYSAAESLFEAGSALEANEIPEYGIFGGSFILASDPDSKEETPFNLILHRLPKTSSNPDGILTAEFLNPNLTDEQAVKHITGCTSFVPPGKTDPNLNALSLWAFYSNIRIGGLDKDGQLIASLLHHYRIRKALLPGEKEPFFIARADIHEPGFSWNGKTWTAVEQNGFFYAIAKTIEPITPATGITPDCSALLAPGSQWVKVEPPVSGGRTPRCRWVRACPPPNAHNPNPGDSAGACTIVRVCD